MVLVRDGRFTKDETVFAPIEDAGATRIDVPGDLDHAVLESRLRELRAVRVAVPGFADGRAFSLAARLRAMGFEGTLRAAGPLLADQYPLALRAGFDEVEIDDDHAARIPEEQWREARDRTAFDYRARLQGLATPGLAAPARAA